MTELRLKSRILLFKSGSVTLLPLVVYLLVFLILFLLPKGYDIAFKLDSIIDSIVGAVLLILIIIFKTSLRLSSCRSFLLISQGKKCGIKDFFYYLSPRYIFNSVGYILLFSLRKLLYFFVSLLPFAVSVGILNLILRNGASLSVSVVTVVCTFFLLVGGGLCYSKLSSLLFLCDYLFVEHRYSRLSDIFFTSRKLMSLHSKKLTRLRFGFAGWFFLCLLIFPAAYVFGYYKQTLAVFANDVIKNQI